MTDAQYISEINAESLRQGYTDKSLSLTGLTGDGPWLEAWRDDPTLTPAEQVEAEIQCAIETGP